MGLGDTIRMADLKVRQLDDRVASALKARARRRGVSLEEEARSTLTAAVLRRRRALARRATASRAAAGGRPGSPALDSARTVREDRDAWG
jgi:plasmid stability protein